MANQNQISTDYLTKSNQLLAAIPAAVAGGKLSPSRVGESQFLARCDEFTISLVREYGGYVLILNRIGDGLEIDRREIEDQDSDSDLATAAFRAMRAKAMNADKAIDDLLRHLDTLG